MTGASHDKFVDRRTPAESSAGLATQILFWYDKDRPGRRGRTRTNAIAISQEGFLLIGRAVCSRKDNHTKASGRMIAAERLLGHDVAAQRRPEQLSRHSSKLTIAPGNVAPSNLATLPDLAAEAYREEFPGDDMGCKRAYNIGKVFMRYLADLDQRIQNMEPRA